MAKISPLKKVSKNITCYKAYLRSGVASFHLGNFEEAKNCFQEGLSEPFTDQKALRQWVHWCDEKMERMRRKRQQQQDAAAAEAAAGLQAASISPEQGAIGGHRSI